VADFSALVADKIEPVDALVDFFPIEHAAPEFFDPDTQQLFVVLFYFAPSGFVTWKIFVFRFIVTTVINVVVTAVLGGATGAFFICAWDIFYFKLPNLDWTVKVYGRKDGFYFIMNASLLVNSESGLGLQKCVRRVQKNNAEDRRLRSSALEVNEAEKSLITV
jgi:hypothetical protein